MSELKALEVLTGNAYSALILTHAVKTWQQMGKQRFQKFMRPCNHRLYVKGTSWCEELGLSRSEFESGFKRISRKVVRFSDPVPESVYIKYYTDSARMSYFTVVGENLERGLGGIMTALNLNAITQEVKDTHMDKLKSRPLNVRQSHNFFMKIMEENGYKFSNIMTSKEAGLLKTLMKAVSGYNMTIQDYFHYSISQWNDLRRQITWEGSTRSRLREKPSIEELSMSRDAIMSALRTEEPAATYKTVTSISDIPTNHPGYEKLVALFKAGVPIKFSQE